MITGKNNRLGTTSREQNWITLIKKHSFPLEKEALTIYIWLDFRITINKHLLRSPTPPLFGFCLNIIECRLWLVDFGFEIMRSRVTTVEKLHLHPDLIKMSRSWNSSMILPVFSNQDHQDTPWMEQWVYWFIVHTEGGYTLWGTMSNLSKRMVERIYCSI